MMSYKNILWDFDGVIIESSEVRINAFRFSLAEYSQQQVDDLIAYHNKNGGLSRYHKFRYFFEEIRGENISEKDVEKLASRFSEYCLGRLSDRSCLLENTVSWIRENYEALNFHIVSGSAQHELREICKRLDIIKYFGDIMGSPVPKTQLVSDLISRHKLAPGQTVLVGDSINDYEAALKNKISFIGFNNKKLMGLDATYIENIDRLNEFLSD